MCAALLRNSAKCLNLRIKPNTLTSRTICTSAFHRSWSRTPSAEVERNLLKADNLPQHFQLIYRAPMESYLNWTKNVSTGTVTFLSVLVGYQLATTMSFINISRKIDISILVSNETDLYYFAAGFVLINLAIRAFVSAFPLRIYKSGKKYVAVYSSQMPMGTVKHSFERGQIGEYKNALNPWSHIMYKLNQRSSMLLIDYFKNPAEFHSLFEEKAT